MTRDFALIILAGVLATAAMIAGVVLVCVGHVSAAAAVAVVGSPSAVAGVALGRLGPAVAKS